MEKKEQAKLRGKLENGVYIFKESRAENRKIGTFS